LNDDDDEDDYHDQQQLREKKLREDTAGFVSKLAMEAVAAASSYSAAVQTHPDVDPSSSGTARRQQQQQQQKRQQQQQQQKMWNEDDLTTVLDRMESTTDAMTDAWKAYHLRTRDLSEERAEDRRRNDAVFREAYMEMVTGAFATELDDMRCGSGGGGRTVDKAVPTGEGVEPMETSERDKNGDEDNVGGGEDIDVEVLVRCLRAGSHVWTDGERRLLVGGPLAPTSTVGALTPHERRRRSLFGDL